MGVGSVTGALSRAHGVDLTVVLSGVMPMDLLRSSYGTVDLTVNSGILSGKL